MDLKFEVNKKHLLQCKQLASEMDPDPDAGSLYGLQSMIVFRNMSNPSQRSIITTLGKLKYRRCGVHVNVRMDNDGEYARSKIDSVLGRLHCLPEPRLLYHKASYTPSRPLWLQIHLPAAQEPRRRYGAYNLVCANHGILLTLIWLQCCRQLQTSRRSGTITLET